MATNDCITTLREQITANAAIAFPNTIHQNGGKYQPNIYSARERVEVVVVEYGESRIVASNKLFRTSIHPTYAAWGALSDSIEGALESLLQELAKTLVEDSAGLPAFGEGAGRSV
ncbi:hypothetical protein AC579_2646 [Pseudocercospora musae]|uniref:Uncharacterized protein n=1 Tax=Pseudocercospora musae TaxID=113226 RepID=A0A139IGP1_9PEZI|nr:hypothetical protein AC579_2646 [Pseudocercospora musae]